MEYAEAFNHIATGVGTVLLGIAALFALRRNKDKSDETDDDQQMDEG